MTLKPFGRVFYILETAVFMAVIMPFVILPIVGLHIVGRGAYLIIAVMVVCALILETWHWIGRKRGTFED